MPYPIHQPQLEILMMKKYISIIPGIIAALAAVSSCIYPFTPKVSASDNRLVIEGDILIGEISEVRISRVNKMYESTSDLPIETEIQIESEDGKRYPPLPVKSNYAKIDLTDAPDNVRYRLCVYEANSGKHYNSAWVDVKKPAVVDALTHHPIDAGQYSPQGSVAIALSMHSNDDSQHFRWSYKETYEYHAQYYATYYYLPPVFGTETWNDGYGVVKKFEDGNNNYYCWRTQESNRIMLFSTVAQNENRFEDLEFHVIPRTSNMLEEVYYIKVYLQALDADAYRYWKSMYDNTYQQGNLFSPTPSSMRGNILCEEDPSEMVLGYIAAARRATEDLYIDNLDTHYYIDNRTNRTFSGEPVDVPKEHWNKRYTVDRWLPYTMEIDDNFREHIVWLPDWCVDCKAASNGGTKTKPAGWPRPEK